MLIIRSSKLHYTASGIITPIGGHLVHRLREDYSPLSTCAWYLSMTLRDNTSQKTVVFILTAMRSSNLMCNNAEFKSIRIR